LSSSISLSKNQKPSNQTNVIYTLKLSIVWLEMILVPNKIYKVCYKERPSAKACDC
jgi:hypothetical protein